MKSPRVAGGHPSLSLWGQQNQGKLLKGRGGPKGRRSTLHVTNMCERWLAGEACVREKSRVSGQMSPRRGSLGTGLTLWGRNNPCSEVDRVVTCRNQGHVYFYICGFWTLVLRISAFCTTPLLLQTGFTLENGKGQQLPGCSLPPSWRSNCSSFSMPLEQSRFLC